MLLYISIFLGGYINVFINLIDYCFYFYFLNYFGFDIKVIICSFYFHWRVISSRFFFWRCFLWWSSHLLFFLFNSFSPKRFLQNLTGKLLRYSFLLHNLLNFCPTWIKHLWNRILNIIKRLSRKRSLRIINIVIFIINMIFGKDLSALHKMLAVEIIWNFVNYNKLRLKWNKKQI